MSTRRRGQSSGDSQPLQPLASSSLSSDDSVSPASPRRSRRIAGQGAQIDNAAVNASLASPVSRHLSGTGAQDQRLQSPDSTDRGPSMQGQSTSQAAEPTIEHSLSFNPQPPSEIRPQQQLPAYVVRLELTGSNIAGRISPFDRGAVNAISRFVTPDGQEINAEAISIPRPVTATAPERHGRLDDVTTWTFQFAPRSVNVSGYFRIRVSIVHTPVVDRGQGEEVDSPVRALTITSRVIHVHAFAPLV